MYILFALPDYSSEVIERLQNFILWETHTVIGAPWGLKKNLNAFVAGTLRGYFLPVRYGSVGVQLTRLRALYQGTLTSGCVWKNLNTSYLYNAAILASFFLIRVFKGVLSSEFVD